MKFYLNLENVTKLTIGLLNNTFQDKFNKKVYFNSQVMSDSFYHTTESANYI